MIACHSGTGSNLTQFSSAPDTVSGVSFGSRSLSRFVHHALLFFSLHLLALGPVLLPSFRREGMNKHALARIQVLGLAWKGVAV